MLQLQLDGMKLVGATPTMLSERNAIIAGAMAGPDPAADAADVREGFRRRGMGFSAANPTGNTVVEAYDSPELTASNPTVTSGNNLLEPNECNTLNVPMTNLSVNAATNITAVLSSSTPGITVTQPNSAYPDMPAGAGPINNTTPFQVSVDNTVACFTSAQFTLTFTFTGGGGGSPETFNFSLPVGIPGENYAFATTTGGTIPAGGVLVPGSQDDDFQVAIPLPAGWSSSIYDVPVTSLSASTNGIVTANAAANTAFTNAVLPAAVGTNPSLFPLWDDMDMDVEDVTGGGIYTQTVGSSPNRQLIIEWRGQHFAEGTNGPITVNYAVTLFEGTSQIRYTYVLTGIAPNANAVSATIGAQRANTGTRFTQFSFNTASITPGTVLTGTLPAGQCTPGPGPCGVSPSVRSRADFDGDGKTDLSVFRPTEGNWYLNRSTAGFQVLKWGIAGDTLVPGDYDADGKTDTAIFRPNADPAQPDFYILNSNGFTVTGSSWGVAGDIPVIADYDVDQKSDIAVFRPSNNTWYILRSGGGTTVTVFGQAGDVPVAGNFDSNPAADLVVYRSGFWVGQLSGGGSMNTALGTAGDVLVPADYSNDNIDDIAVFRPSTGQWLVINSQGGGVNTTAFGAAGDVPVPGDYDGDGRDDFAIYRNGTWWVNRSTSGLLVQAFGLSTDTAIPRRYIP
jgi:putative transposon-encoded protein